MTDTHLSRDGARALERELLDRLIVAGGVSTIAEMFDGFRPQWAFDAADRLEDRGLVELLEDRSTRVTEAGYAANKLGA